METANVSEAPDYQLLLGPVVGHDGKYYVGLGVKHLLGSYNQSVMFRPLGGIAIALRLLGLSLWGLCLRK